MSYKVTDTTIVDQSRNISNIGIATFAGPLLVGSGSSTGTPLQVFQVTGSNGAYVGGNLGIGSTNPSSKLSISGDAFATGIITGSVLVAAKDPGTGIATDSTECIFGNGWRLSAPASTTYYRLATLPAGGGGNTFDHLTISGVLGSWTSTNQTPFEIYFSNRASFNFKYTSYGTVRSDVRIIAISTNGSIEIWAQHQASQFTKLVYNITNSLQAIVATNPTSTTTAPVGTTVFDSSTATPRFIINDSDNVGIGTTNPQTRLQINGVLGFSSNNNIRIGDNFTGSSITSGSHNFFAGASAGRNTTGGGFNIFIGQCSGHFNTSGVNNNFFGFYSGYCNAGGSNNNFFGSYAGCLNTGAFNNFFGPGVGRSNTSGSCNNFFGNYAGRYNTTGSYNNFFGRNAGLGNTTSSHSIAIGSSAGFFNRGNRNIYLGQNAGWVSGRTGDCVTGTDNIVMGCSAGARLTTGRDNTFFGRLAGCSNTTGTDNNFFGVAAGLNNIDGSSNNFFGFYSGCSNTTGSGNNFLGYYAGCGNINGNDNNFFGNNTGLYNITGSCNNFFGSNAGCSNTTGSGNNFLGYCAGSKNTTGSYNNFFGFLAGFANTTGTHNNFFGCYAGRNNTTGINNNFFGNFAGRNNTEGCNNNFFGAFVGYYNTTGSYNTFFGNGAGRYNTTGCLNNFFGFNAGFANTTGTNNNFIGHRAGYYNTTGSYNNFFGRYAGINNTTGINNNFFGNFAGCTNVTGSQNIVIGFNQNTPIVSGSNQLVIGSGNTSWINGNSSYNVGIGSTNPTSKLTVVGNVLVSGVVTATSFRGDGSQLTGIVASGSGIIIRDDGSLVGTASSIDFGSNLSVSPVSAGVVTVTASGGGGSSQWVTTVAGIHTLSKVGIGTTNPTALLTVKSTSVTDFVGLFSGTTDADLVRITQDGLGNALRVDDQAGGTTPFIVDNLGRVGINTITATSTLTVFGDSRITGISTSQYLDGAPIATLSGSMLAYSYGMLMP